MPRSDDMMNEQLSEDSFGTVPGAKETYGVQGVGIVVPRRPRVAMDQDALVLKGDGVYVYKRFSITPLGMTIPDDATDDELLEIGAVLDSLNNSILWNIGDWFSRADRVWGQMYLPPEGSEGYKQAAQKYDTLRDYAWIARSVNLSIRNRQLSFSHHRNIAVYDEYPEFQWWWLEYAASQHLTVSAMKADMVLIGNLGIEDQIAKLQLCISQNERLPKRKSPALPDGNPDPVEQIRGSARLIAKYWDSLPQLQGKKRDEAIAAGLEQRRLVNEYLRRLGVG